MHTTRTTRRAVGVIGATIAALSAPLLTSVAEAADPPRQAVCDEFACLLNLSGHDSDGDGVTDDDERAYGTDPHDPESHPPVLDLLGAAMLKQLPSFVEGHTVVVGLPATDRDASVAGLLGTPGDVKVEIADLGKRLTLEGASALVGGSVQGMVEGLMGDHTPQVIPAGKAGGIDPTIAAGYEPGDTQQLGMTITVHQDGSSTSTNGSFTYSGKYTGELYNVVTQRDPKGHTTSITATVTIINDDLDGAEYTTITEFDAEGNVVSQTTSCTANCPPPPEEPKEPEEPQDPDDGGDDSDGSDDSSEPGDYPIADGDTAIVYTNADEMVWVVSPSDVDRAIRKLGWNTNGAGPVQIDADPSTLPPAGPDPLVALFDDSGTVVIGATGPIDYDRIGGNVTPGPAVPLPTEVPNTWGGTCVSMWAKC